MLITKIIQCDVCGYRIDCTQEEYAENFDGKDLCDECLKKALEAK